MFFVYHLFHFFPSVSRFMLCFRKFLFFRSENKTKDDNEKVEKNIFTPPSSIANYVKGFLKKSCRLGPVKVNLSERRSDGVFAIAQQGGGGGGNIGV